MANYKDNADSTLCWPARSPSSAFAANHIFDELRRMAIPSRHVVETFAAQFHLFFRMSRTPEGPEREAVTKRYKALNRHFNKVRRMFTIRKEHATADEEQLARRLYNR